MRRCASAQSVRGSDMTLLLAGCGALMTEDSRVNNVRRCLSARSVRSSDESVLTGHGDHTPHLMATQTPRLRGEAAKAIKERAMASSGIPWHQNPESPSLDGRSMPEDQTRGRHLSSSLSPRRATLGEGGKATIVTMAELLGPGVERRRSVPDNRTMQLHRSCSLGCFPHEFGSQVPDLFRPKLTEDSPARKLQAKVQEHAVGASNRYRSAGTPRRCLSARSLRSSDESVLSGCGERMRGVTQMQSPRLRGEAARAIADRAKSSSGIPWRGIPRYNSLGTMCVSGQPQVPQCGGRAMAVFSESLTHGGVMKELLSPIREKVPEDLVFPVQGTASLSGRAVAKDSMLRGCLGIERLGPSSSRVADSQLASATVSKAKDKDLKSALRQRSGRSVPAPASRSQFSTTANYPYSTEDSAHQHLQDQAPLLQRRARGSSRISPTLQGAAFIPRSAGELQPALPWTLQSEASASPTKPEASRNWRWSQGLDKIYQPQTLDKIYQPTPGKRAAAAHPGRQKRIITGLTLLESTRSTATSTPDLSFISHTSPSSLPQSLSGSTPRTPPKSARLSLREQLSCPLKLGSVEYQLLKSK